MGDLKRLKFRGSNFSERVGSKERVDRKRKRSTNHA